MSNLTNTTNATSNSTTPAVPLNPGEELGAFLFVAFMASLGGFAIMILNGLDIPKFRCFKGIQTRPLLGRVRLPPLIGMAIMGMVSRNLFGVSVSMYQETWGSYLREVCVNILLMRGGLLISFKGKGLTLALISWIP